MDHIEEPGTASETPKKGSKSKAMFTCDICGKSYKYLRSYVKHQEEHKIRGSTSDKPGTQSTPARIPVVKSGKRGCSKRSTQEESVSAQISDVNRRSSGRNELAYRCSYPSCGQSYTNQNALLSHQEKHHSEAREKTKNILENLKGLKSQPCAKLSRESKKDYRNTVKPSKISHHEHASGSSEMPASGLAITHHTAENVQMKDVEIEAAASCSNSLVYASYTDGYESAEPIESDGMIKITKVWSLAISQAEFLRMLEAEEKVLADLCSESTGDKEL